MEPPKEESFRGHLRFRFVRGLAVCSAVTSLLFLSPSAFAGGQHDFSIKVFTSSDDQFWTNSVIIEGTHEVMLVDAQLTKTNAERVLLEIKETKKPLSLIYITHEHADHFLGLEVFREAYPRVRIIANSAVVDRINKVYREKIDKWKTILGSGATSQVVAIEKFDGDFIKFESSKIEVLRTFRATPMKTRCFGFLDRESSLPAMSCSITCTSTPQKRTVRQGRNG